MEIIDLKYKINDLLIDNKDSSKDMKDYLCMICFDSLIGKEILQCKEGHHFCSNCWLKSLNNIKECVECRIPINSINDLSRNRFIENIFLEKKIYCPYLFKFQIDSNEQIKLIKDYKYGCKDIIKLDQLKSHLLECKFKFVKCTNDGCGKVIRFNQLKSHLSTDCQYNSLNCKHCLESILVSKTKLHLNECPSIIVKCPQCPIRLKRGHIESHIENECLNSIVPCKYKDGGCLAHLKRSELPSHLDKINHSLFLNSFIDNLQSQLNESNKNYMDLVQKLNRLETYLNQSKKYSNDWIIQNFTNINLGIGEFYKSSIISIGNFNFELLFYLNMSNEYLNSFSLFIRETNKRLIKIKFQIKLVNYLNQNNNIEKSFCKKLEQNGLGWPNILEFKKINKENGWLDIGDKLKIEFKISLKENNNVPIISN